MVKTIAGITALLLMVSAASAACPIGTKYQCHPSFGGKMQCGCY